MPFVTCGHILNVLLFLQLNTPKKNWYCSTCFLLFPFNDFVNDTDFYFTIHGVQFSSSFDDSDFNPKYFNPFLEDTNSYSLLLNSDLDPDINIFTSKSHLLSKCSYMKKLLINLRTVPTN